MSKFILQKYKDLVPYTPGEQPTGREFIKLNTNEMPYPPSEGVLRAIGDDYATSLQLYPDPSLAALKSTLAKKYGVKVNNITAGNGSDDILAFIFMAYCADNTPVAFADITYGFYKVFGDIFKSDYEQIPLTSDLEINCDDYIGIGKNIFIANPNAPTGITLSLSDIEKIANTNPDNIVVIDEAYVDFGTDTAIPLIDEYDNIIIVRTFSKSSALAGARLGFAVASEALIEDIEIMRYSTNPYNVNRVTISAGIAAVNDRAYYDRMCKKIIETREWTKKRLIDRDFTLTDSSANFLFMAHDKIDGKELYQFYKKYGILVRHFDVKRICNFLRVTIGTQQQMETFIEVTDKILGCVEK